MVDDWLDELDQIRQADEQHRQEIEEKLDLSVLEQPSASDLLRTASAHLLLRRVNSVLLHDAGLIDVYERSGPYERVITLVWQGPVSSARRPDPEDPSDYYYLAVGVKGGQLYVNDKPLVNATPEALKQALVAAAKNPGRQKSRRTSQTDVKQLPSKK